ncbi:MAG: hypothetical protein ACYC5Y_05350 [Symbiobacteriia bacterium]
MLTRVAVCQLDYNPAFSGRAVSYLAEPLPPGKNDTVGLHSLPPTAEVRSLRAEIQDIYLSNLSAKLSAILAYAGQQHVEILVFPEYSIPAQVLPQLKSAAQQHGIIVVAGSHTVTSSDQALEAYEACGLGAREGSKKLAGDVRMALAPVFLPNGEVHGVYKQTRSPWEGQMILGPSEWGWLDLQPAGFGFQLGVLICSDALHTDIGTIMRTAKSGPRLLVIVSLSPTTKVFEQLANLVLYHETPVAFANSAAFGGSAIYFHFGSREEDWFTSPSGTTPLPHGDEALIIADLDLSGQFSKSGSVMSQPAGRIFSIAPILYPASKEAADEYCSLATRLLTQDVIAKKNASELQAKQFEVLPKLLVENNTRLTDGLISGNLIRSDLEFLLSHIGMPADVLSPNDVRFDAVQRALSTTMSLMNRPDADIAKCSTVLKHLTQGLTGLKAPERPHATSDATAATAEDGTASEDAMDAFQDRAFVFAKVRTFERRDERVLIMQGMRGVGKTATAVQVLRKIYPKWNSIWIKATDSMRFPKFISLVAQGVGRPVDPVAANCADDSAVDSLVEKLIQAFDSLKRCTLIIDDFEYLLNSDDGTLRDSRIAKFFTALIHSGSASNNRVYVLTSRTPHFGLNDDAGCFTIFLQGLDSTPFMERLLEYWIRFNTDRDDGEPVTVRRDLIELLHGNPLAAKIAASACQKVSQEDLVNDLRVFKRFQKELVEALLDRISLSSTETTLVSFLATFRLGVDLQTVFNWAGDDALAVLESLLDKFLVEFVGDKYYVHPLVREHFYRQTSPEDVHEYHLFAARSFKELLGASDTSSLDANVVSEMIYHAAQADSMELVQGAIPYVDELRPAALYNYRKQNFIKAVELYNLVLAQDPKDWESNYYLSLCYASMHEIPKAQAHFETAISQRETWWMSKEYGLALARARELSMAESVLQQAYEMAPAKSKGDALAALARKRDIEGQPKVAQDLFQKALQSSGASVPVVVSYAHFLVHQRQYEEAVHHLHEALKKHRGDRWILETTEWVEARKDGRTLGGPQTVDNNDDYSGEA